ncbi:MAG: hypothetical protein IPH62_02345 [Ignavibacteriae bacterium]|nr:hypothetical protein [Ignavibacteriota bacterium]
MKKIIVILFLLSIQKFYAQYEIGGGMGLSFFNASDLRDYINANFSSGEDIPSFTTSADFFTQFNYNLSEKYQLGVEYNFNIFSFNSLGYYNLQLNKHKPSLLFYYCITGNGFKFKFGGGLGIRIVQAEEELGSYGSKNNYITKGYGILAKAQGDTKLGENFYALIAGEIFYDAPGEIKTVSYAKFNVAAFGVGLKLGVIYYF